MKQLVLFILLSFLTHAGCRMKDGDSKNEIIIFHAGSLSLPLREIAGTYEKKHPGTRILLEPAGSLVCARKVTELKKPCDIVVSADHFVINKMLIPQYASWGINFATNEIVIAFQDKSRFSSVMDSSRWMDILTRENVTFARSDPDSDPCGYRSVITIMLAEKYYGIPGISEKLIKKNREFIRPKEIDLVALLEVNVVDYIFTYKSVAIQHNLRFVTLPAAINLGDPGKNDFYGTVSVDVAGNSPGSSITIKGEYINYCLTIIDNAINKEGAIDFVSFLLGSEGMKILRERGQDPIIPFIYEYQNLIPDKLLIHLLPGK